jgi:hypothetical protein
LPYPKVSDLRSKFPGDSKTEGCLTCFQSIGDTSDRDNGKVEAYPETEITVILQWQTELLPEGKI